MSLLKSSVRQGRRLLQRLFAREETARTRAIADILEQTIIFRELSRGELAELAETMHRREYRRDEFLYYENDPGMGLYIIHRGAVRLLVESEDGTVHEIHKAGEGSVIGLLSLPSHLPRMETAQAMIDTQVLGFFRPDLNALLKRHPRLGARIMAALARHLAQRQASIMEALSEEKGRVAAHNLLYSAEQVAVE